MKICFFSGDITRSGGTERVSIQLANTLQKKPNYEISFLSLTEQEETPFYDLHPAIKRYRLGERWINPGPGYLPLIGKLRRFLRKHQIDILIDIDMVLDVLSIPAARHTGTKVVSWEHFTVDFERSVRYRRLILRYSVKRSDYIVVLTDGDLEAYRNELGRRRAIRRIYNPVAYRYENTPVAQREKLIVTVGRLTPEKGMDDLQTVAAAVLERYPDWRWLLLGEGPEREKLERFVAEHGLHGRLVLKGNVSNVDEYLARASIFVMTSRYEGLGLSMMEARELKVPCVSFDVKMGPQELIHHERDGFLVPAFDCAAMAGRIGQLVEDPALRSRFAERAYDRMEQFHMECIAGQWEELLNLL